MSFFTETASAIKSRFGYHKRTSSSSSLSDFLPNVKSTPDLNFKSAAKDAGALSVRRFNDNVLDEDEEDSKIVPSRSFEFHEDPSFWKDNNVQVIIRVRPLSSSEISLQGRSKCVRQDSSQSITWIGHPESRFTFDLVADENVTQEMLFNVTGVPMVENCMGGYNSCMFAYGQTGSGKTHTMLGDIEGGTRRHSVNCGMTPRVFEFLFSRIQKEREVRREEKIKYTCRCSFLEIYNEQILDLLDPSSSNLQIREDNKKGIYVENLTEVEVASARDVMQQLLQGANNRKVAATNMNAASSRSHSVFTCTVESKWESQGVTHHRFSRLNLVDLAGSERQKSSGAEGERLKEATNINKSLSTLGLVIMNLVNASNGKNPHVPYRDSKLTFLLQDSLGGNAKTIIIANISPAISCSLETLSTLKFAQRAKYIKNHAIVNEDASGDVIAMRVQIQNLKKEVTRLKGLVNGGAENHETNAESPGPFKWEGFPGLSSPLISDKRKSQRKDYEAALVGAFRREKDKDVALEAMAAENQAAMQLAKQREDEIQGLKMRLRFREAGIKRLEAVASGKISAETHLLKEKEEHLKEIEVLRTQVDRNQEVTRFAMENLRLKEEIRRLKSFCEEGERERMTEQIATLQNKLLEALDWKLMHESDSSFEQKLTSPVKTSSKDDLLLSTQDPVSPWRTSVSEENEFLRMQAIQNQSELDSLRRKLDTFDEEKQKLQSYVNELEAKHEKEKLELEAKLCQMLSIAAGSDQIELKTMVDAIAAASQREAEAHETAIFLSKENEGLKMKLKFLIDDNNKLIELYEQAMEENKTKSVGSQVQDADQEKDVESLKHQLAEMHEENDRLMGLYEKAMLEKDGLMGMKHQLEEMHEENDKLLDLYAKVVREKDELMGMKHQVEEMHEENDRLMGLYEKAMQEKTELMGMKHQLEEMHKESEKLYDQAMHENEELKQNLASKTRNSLEFGELKPQEKLVESDSGDNHEVVDLKSEDSSMSIDEESVMSETAMYEVNVQDYCLNKPEIRENDGLVGLSEEMKLFRTKLVEAQEKISKSVETMSILGLFERTIFEVDEMSGKLERIENKLQEKQEEHESYKHEYSELNKKKVLVDRKWGALRYSLSNFSESINYFEQREVQTRARLEAASTLLNQKKDELVCLQACKDAILDKKNKSTESESKLKSNLHELKLKLEGETQRLEKDRVLISIENVDKPDGQQLHTQRNWQLSCRATELLMSEEMVTKFQIEMKQTQEKLQISKKQHEELNKQLAKVETQIHITQDDVEHASCAKEEMKRKLQAVINEKESVLEMIENGEEEFERLILEYHECVIESGLKQEEVKILEDELEDEFRQIEEMQILKALATSRRSELLEGFSSQSESRFLSGKVVEDLESIRLVIVDLNSVINGQLICCV